MKASEVLKLIEAGFTKAEILAMENPETDAAPDPEPEAPAAEPEPAPEQETKPVVEPPAAGNPQIDALTKQINSLVSVIQRSNLLNSQQPAAPAETAEDILASIIRPTHKRAD